MRQLPVLHSMIVEPSLYATVVTAPARVLRTWAVPELPGADAFMTATFAAYITNAYTNLTVSMYSANASRVNGGDAIPASATFLGSLTALNGTGLLSTSGVVAKPSAQPAFIFAAAVVATGSALLHHWYIHLR